MVDVRWHFRPMQRAEINQDPMEREFFSGESINERLVREAVQNSLDAGRARVDRASSEPVRVRLSLRGVRNPLEPYSADAYLQGLEEHLEAGLDRDDTFRRTMEVRGLLTGAGMPYLVVEDAGTVGLEGDWSRYDDSEDDPAHNEHFYWFFRNVGRSGKRDEDAGSWGLGKWVFPDASNVSAFIAVTRRHSDGEILLMGQSVLKKHHVEEQRYAPYGYFAELDSEGLPVPLNSSKPEHRAFIDQCITDFDLRLREESGLSIIVPFPRVDSEQISKEQVLMAVVHNYFYPITTGRLEVTVNDGDDDGETVNADTVDDVAASLPLDTSGERSSESYRRLFQMCREAASIEHVELSSPPLNVQGYPDRDRIVEMRRQYDRGDLLAFRVRTVVKRQGDNHNLPTAFRLYVQKDDSLSEGHDYYVRGPLSIAEEDHLGRRSARALLVIDEYEPLAAMLRDSEPPAHNYWRPQNERVGKRWVGAYGRIKRVREAPSALLSIWETTPVGLDKDALADIFPAGGGTRRRRSPKGEPPVGPGPIRLDPPPSHQQFDIHQLHDGFSVRFARDIAHPPSRMRLRAAYETPRGNPLTNYNVNDFRLFGAGALDVSVQGCQTTQNGDKGNELILEIDDPHQFFVTVRGFDPHRDLLVDVQALPGLQSDNRDPVDEAQI